MHPAVLQLDQLGIARTRLVVDSREVQPGDVFAAYQGHAADGRDFIEAAVNAGAAAVLMQAGLGTPAAVAKSRVPVLAVADLARVVGSIADDFYGRPSLSLRVAGVTGTNGKTTVANWLAQCYEALGEPSGVIGTLGIGRLNQIVATKNTTPDGAALHAALAMLRTQGAKAVAMEVSSHALDQRRVAGLRFDSAVFTNLSQDHLDYHHTLAAYGEAKAKLFTDYPTRHRIINADDIFGAQLIARKFPQTVSYGLDGGLVRGRLLTPRDVRTTASSGLMLRIESPWGEFEIATDLIGRFNAYNLLAVAATLLAQGFNPAAVADALAGVQAAPGRMQRISIAADPAVVPLPRVFVDYAHTPDALEKAIDALRQSTRGKLIVVFGCGGDRDRSKRPQMGAIAASHADGVIVTSDNPRTEHAQLIIDQIIAGIETSQRAHVGVVPDRGRAIAYAVEAASTDDSILIAGKGHEDYQEIMGLRHHFSDVEVAQAALIRRVQVEEPAHAH
jgi:UDP-N-acetylmuramoyl-L-alanyl-D-glutamate--2,6-diaminopimelate ligase